MALSDWLSLLLNRLPKFINTATSSNSYKIFNTVARELDMADSDIAFAKLQENINSATGISLDLHGGDYGLPRKGANEYWAVETRQCYYTSPNSFDVHFGNVSVQYQAGSILRITQGIVTTAVDTSGCTYNPITDITSVVLQSSILTPALLIDMVEIDTVVPVESDTIYRNRLLNSYNRPQLTKPSIVSILRPMSFQVPKVEEYIDDRWFAMESSESVIESQTSSNIRTVATDYDIAYLDGIWLATDISSSYGYANNATYVNSYVVDSSGLSPTYGYKYSSVISLGTDLPSSNTNLKISYRTNLIPRSFVGVNIIAQYQSIMLNAYPIGNTFAFSNVGVDKSAYIDQWNSETASFAYLNANHFTISDGNYCGKYQIGDTIRITQGLIIAEVPIVNCAYDRGTDTTTVTTSGIVLSSTDLDEIEVNGNVVSVVWVGIPHGADPNDVPYALPFTWTTLVIENNGVYSFQIKDDYRTDYYYRTNATQLFLDYSFDALYTNSQKTIAFVGMFDPQYNFRAYISEQRILYGTVVYGTKRVYGGFLGVQESDIWNLVDSAKPAGTQFSIEVVSPYDNSAYYGAGTYGRIIYGLDNYL